MVELMNDTGKSRLDPRTKLALLVIIAVFVLGGTGGKSMGLFRIVLSAIPFVLMLFSGKILSCIAGCAVVGAGFAVQMYIIPVLHGIPASILLMVCGIVTSLVPCIMMGRYMISTTTVSAFIAAMERMHVTEKITIPLSVMFRFFPTVQEEFFSINAAMKMRGIHFCGSKAGNTVEYRLVPMIMCSVRIGDELSASALTRGLGAPVKRTNICKIGFGLPDVLLLALCAAVIIFWGISLTGAI